MRPRQQTLSRVRWRSRVIHASPTSWLWAHTRVFERSTQVQNKQ
ncbi:hypothetical protein [Rothia endophytica]|nr:hypothetical protein [Rothia endophytica]